ncbi:MAG: GNAT family N-acetyltransferase [Gammaproteobacteria bacterium]|nr:GNAT family N-acetyltransferase [Gammaproteobacteria bacterium]
MSTIQTTSNMTLQPLQKEHLPLLLTWLETPHVKAWWDPDINWSMALVEEKYGGIRLQGYYLEQGVLCAVPTFIIVMDKTPIGLIQMYNPHDFQLAGLPEYIVGVDLFIGEPAFLHQGLGGKAITLVLEQYATDRYTHAFVDPKLDNIAAIKCYEKAGFKAYKTQTISHELWMLKVLNETTPSTPQKWAIGALKKQGFQLKSDFSIVRHQPWSEVDSIETGEGSIFLKTMVKPFSREAMLIEYLSQQVSEKHLPACIALYQPLHCFLMKNAGHPLRAQLQNKFDIQLIKPILTHYAELQIKSIQHINAMLALAIPDWRLCALPHHYEAMLQEKTILEQDGLTSDEIEQLISFKPYLEDLCQQLSDLQIPATLEHGDFHDNNVLIQNHHFTINDWADASITHPFFSLISWLNSAHRHHGLQAHDQQHTALIHAYLQPWHTLISPEVCVHALQTAWKIHPIIFALNFMRIHRCPGISQYPQYIGYIADSLRIFIQSARDNL